jgi:hypothetical protein
MGISIPFDLSAASVPRQIDLMGLSIGDGTQLEIFVSECEPDDVIQSLLLVAKRDVNDSDIAVTTINKTITTTPSAAGVLAQTPDDSVWQGKFNLTAVESIRLARLYQYSIRASVLRGGVTYTRITQTGQMQAQAEATNLSGPYADGSFFADGEIFADGLPSS